MVSEELNIQENLNQEREREGKYFIFETGGSGSEGGGALNFLKQIRT